MDDVWRLGLLALAGLAAGAVNSVAGGGTLFTFPALLSALGTGPAAQTLANGTNKLATVPGSLASAFGYRREVLANRRLVLWLLPPSVAGAVLGTLLVTRFDDAVFATLVPWLILTAVLLLAVQKPLTRWAKRRTGGVGLGAVAVMQFAVSVYGGYFGAGIGILMLTLLGFLDLPDFHHVNGLKNLLSGFVGAVSAVTFVVEGKVDFLFGAVMAVAAIAGGYFGARLARRVSADRVRAAVVCVGFGLAAYYLGKQLA